jgi:hypothetical protein
MQSSLIFSQYVVCNIRIEFGGTDDESDNDGGAKTPTMVVFQSALQTNRLA